jgi:hypothetical protein
MSDMVSYAGNKVLEKMLPPFSGMNSASEDDGSSFLRNTGA